MWLISARIILVVNLADVLWTYANSSLKGIPSVPSNSSRSRT